jgi:multidrug efflux pump
VILKDPAVLSLSSFIGIDGTNTTLNSGRIQINLKPLEDRRMTASDVIRRLQPELDVVGGITLYMQPVQDLTVDDRVSRTQYQYTLEDPNSAELNQWTAKLVAKLQASPLLRDVATDQQNAGMQEQLVIDRDTASRLGITPTQIDETLYDAFGQRQVSTMFTQLNQYHVVLEVAAIPADGARLARYLSAVNHRGPGSAERDCAPGAIRCSAGDQPSGTIPVRHAVVQSRAGRFAGDAVTTIEQTQHDLGMPLSISAAFQGTAAAFEASLANEPVLILAALITVYIVLGVLYESYVHPITILSTLPSAGVGALLALLICGEDFSVIALIGVILLIGIVKKNGIMMVDFALEAQRHEGKTALAAIFQASLLRFRPIMMTTLAALFGGLPLAMGSGTGSELRRPLGIAIVGGLIFSQILTLYTTPVIYLWFDRLASRFGMATQPEPAPAAEGA